jgi:hypothetical protein
MDHSRIFRCSPLVVAAVAFAGAIAWCGEKAIGWNPETAGKYLDERGKAWFAYSPADRGKGETRSTCVSCHTLAPYALARPVLRKVANVSAPTSFEDMLLTQTRKRVENWAALDTPAFSLLYDFSPQKKKESWGTEAVLNAFILACGDQSEGRSAPSKVTLQALANLWKTQLMAGAEKGSWEWLNFGMEPWEATGSRFYGTAMAAIAVGSAPGYYRPGADPALDGQVKLLRDYLTSRLPDQNLFNKVWALWAATKLDGLLSAEGRNKIIAELLTKQQADGGWALPSLGTFKRSDGSPQSTASDGYATGLVLYALQNAGLAKDDPKLVKGLAWLKTNQTPTGEWRAISVNKKRDPATHVGKFMTDAATGYAVLALSQEERR